MEYTLTNANTGNIAVEDLYNFSITTPANVFTKFLSWCEAQNSDRFLWLGISLFAQIGLTLPVTIYAILFFGGNSLLLWISATAVNIPVLVLNLAALPTRTTLPFVFFGWLTQFAIIIYCIVAALIH
ncbi:MAG: hypothetical protein ABI405_01335 [Parafilimonas sp.]